MITTWIFGIIFCLLGMISFMTKIEKLIETDEDFKKLKEEMMKDDTVTNDTGIPTSSILLLIIMPYINILFGFVFWGLVFVPAMWNSFIEYLFEKF